MSTTLRTTSYRRRIGWLILVLLLLVRIPYSGLLTYSSASPTGWGPAISQLSNYCLTALLIWWERDDLSAMHIDTLTLVLIVLFKPAQTLLLRYWNIQTPLTFPHPAGLLIWAVAIALTAAIFRNARKPAPITGTSATWSAAGLLAGFMISAVLSLDAFRQVRNLAPLPSVTVSTGMAFFYQLGFATVAEEPLFRGFLWGYLRRLGWREVWVWLVQMVLFMLAHLYFINALHFQFWILIPASALVFGLFAWQSRSVAPGMLAHAAINASAYILLLNALAALLKLP